MRLTDLALQNLKPPETGAKVYTDDTVPNFAVKVTSGGAKSFILTVGRERKRITVGRYGPGGLTLAEARKKAQGILRDRDLGIVEKTVPTLNAVKDEYLARRSGDVRPATLEGDRYLFKHFDGLMNRKLSNITAADIEKIIDGVDAPSTRRSAYIRISGLFSYAVRKEYIDKSPVRAVEMPPDQAPRHRVLSDAELKKVLMVAQMLRLAGDQYGAIVELLIFTGQRARQIGDLHRSHIDFENDTIEWPPEKMKTGKRHVIPMGAAVKELLRTRDASDFYFPNRAGGTFCGWSYHFRKLTQEVGFADFVVHDLRRTMATRWQEMGIEIATTEKMLSHSAVTGGLVGIYQRSTYLAQMRDAVQKWESYLSSLLSNSEDKECLMPILQTSSLASVNG